MNSSLRRTFLYSTSALLSIGPRSGAATIGNPSVFKKLPSTAADTLLANWSLREEVELRAVLAAVLRFELDRPARRPAGDDVDDAAHRDVAVQTRRRALGDLDAVHAGERHAGPVHPPAERIVERDAVEQDERAALTARADPAQRDALRGRLRHQAAGPAKEAERGHLPQHVVGEQRRRRFDRFAREDADTRRHVAEPLLGSCRRHRHGLEQRRRLDGDFDAIAFEVDAFCVFSAKPPARTTMVTSPVSGVSMVKRPSGPVIVCRSAPDAGLTMTAAPGTTPPIGSRTTPEIDEVARASMRAATTCPPSRSG